MSPQTTQYSAESDGFILSGREWRIVSIATALVGLNALMMYLFAMTPLAIVNRYLFAIPIVGMVVFGGGLMLGEHIARVGVKDNDVALAYVGVGVIEVTYGIFGAGVLSYAPQSLHLPAIAITGVVTAILTFVVGAYIYARDIEFAHWRSWSVYSFIGAFVAGLIGTFVNPVLILTFVLIIAGFIFRLGWEIWRIKAQEHDSDLLRAIGLYVAVMGLFVHVLQIVLRLLAKDN